MTEEIKAIIEKSLPAQVGEVLRTALEQGKKDAERVKQLETDNERIRSERHRLQEAVNSYQKFDERNSGLDKREADLNEGNRNLKVETLKFQLLAEQEKTEFAKSVALGLVRNTEYKRTIFDSQSEPGKDQWGNYITTTKSQNSDEKKTAI